MRVKAQQEILVGCSKRITLKNVQVFSGKTFMWLLAAPHKDENPITDHIDGRTLRFAPTVSSP